LLCGGARARSDAAPSNPCTTMTTFNTEQLCTQRVSTVHGSSTAAFARPISFFNARLAENTLNATPPTLMVWVWPASFALPRRWCALLPVLLVLGSCPLTCGDAYHANT